MENIGWVQIVMALILTEIAKLLIASTYKKLTGNKYVTKSDCSKCQASDTSNMKALREEMRTMRGIMLVMAVKLGIPEDQWQRLAN